MKVCSRCHEPKPLVDFAWRWKTKGIRLSACKACYKKSSHEFYIKHTTDTKRRASERKQQIRKWLKEYKTTLSCSWCGEDDPICLDFHHRDPTKKIINISYIASRGWGIKRIQQELEKCTVLCSNCHRKLEAGL